MSTAIVIPAYEPTPALVDVAEKLAASDVSSVVVVDDGSSPACRPIFERVQAIPKVRLLRHAVNLGKGAALKTGINACLCEDPDAVIVTADADGQHLPEDVLRVAERGKERRDALVLGARGFDGAIPLRSRFGNELTRRVLRLVLGFTLRDTQTGLRAIPTALAPHLLRLASRRYEFELDMLVLCKQLGIPVVESPIATVYLDGNASSHFNPLLDSMRIYFVLFRFVLTSLSTALIDNVGFAAFWALLSPALSFDPAVLASQLGGRVAAVIFNYAAVKRLVFASRQRHARAIPKYLLLVAGSGAVSYMVIGFLVRTLGMNVFAAKILAESALFLPNFVIQRDLVFRATVREEATGTAATP